MGKINIVSSLMDKLPAKYKEGFNPADIKHPYILVGYSDLGTLADAIRNCINGHRVYYYQPEHDREALFQTIYNAVVTATMAGNGQSTTMYLLKVQLFSESNPWSGGKSYRTELADMFGPSVMYAVIDDGKRVGVERTGYGDYVLELDMLVDFYDDQLPLVMCGMMPDISPFAYDPAVHGITIKK